MDADRHTDRQTDLPTDPVALLRELDADMIRARLDGLARERAALLVLLRAAQRAERTDKEVSRARR
jgi:hypothetical protein